VSACPPGCPAAPPPIQELLERCCGLQETLPLLASNGQAFWFSQPPVLLRGLHQIDMQAGANVAAPEAVTTRSTRDRYLISSLMEEAITSSQMEGAATTRDLITQLAPQGPRWGHGVVHRYQSDHGPQRDPVPERLLPA